jgi:uroporphyrinogen III methyltransferase/synthase
MSGSTGRVWFIGAGPGDPGLVTARGVRLLGEADVVIYDRAAEGALRWARPDAERIAAGAPAEREMALDAISLLLAEKVAEGHRVARVKWGDGFLFGSGAKEALFLREQGIAFEIVPGVTPAAGAGAYAGVPLTYPGAGDAYVVLRGNEDETDALPNVDWEALARVDGTIACYAGARTVPALLSKLIEGGRAPDETVALVSHGTTPRQRTVIGTLQELCDATAGGYDEAALVLAGRAAGLREYLRWFDQRPLFGRRIVVTRSPEQARPLVEELEQLGAQAIEAPTFRPSPPDDPEALDRAAASVDEFDWLVFESANAVTRFLGALLRGPRDMRALGRVSVCAVGPSTAERLLGAGIKSDVVVPEFRTEHIGAHLERGQSVAAQRVLIVRPDHLRDMLAQDLAARGALVTDLVAYRTAAAAPDSPAAQALYRLLLDNAVDAVTFTSPTAVSRFAALIGEEQAADLLNTTVVAAIGPVTAAAAEELGIHTPVVASTYTVEGLLEALVDHFRAAAPAARS